MKILSGLGMAIRGKVFLLGCCSLPNLVMVAKFDMIFENNAI